MIELYYGPGACSFVPHVGLELIKLATGHDYVSKALKLHKGEHLTPEYLKLNPDGKVPMLVVDGQTLTQLVAIADYLDRRFPEAGLMPSDPWQRAQAMSMLIWCNNTVHPTFAHFFRSEMFATTDAGKAEVKAKAIGDYAKLMAKLEAHAAAADPFLGGKQPSFNDAYAVTLYRWSGFTGMDRSTLPKLQALVKRLIEQPAFATIVEREKLTFEFPTAA